MTFSIQSQMIYSSIPRNFFLPLPPFPLSPPFFSLSFSFFLTLLRAVVPRVPWLCKNKINRRCGGRCPVRYAVTAVSSYGIGKGTGEDLLRECYDCTSRVYFHFSWHFASGTWLPPSLHPPTAIPYVTGEYQINITVPRLSAVREQHATDSAVRASHFKRGARPIPPSPSPLPP